MASCYNLLILTVIVSMAVANCDGTDYFNYFIRTLGSLDPKESVINYFNGTVFGKQPGNPLQLLFLFEGYNINRKLAQSDGTYLSLSREFAVYRDPETAEILKVWLNPWSSQPNEVFCVANDPVDATLDPDAASSYKSINPKVVAFNSDVVLEYPNPLSPANYSKYSAGPVYDAAELFTFFANLTDLEGPSNSVPAIGTWVRKSQYLPWMMMGNSSGGLYYTAMSWKCMEGLSCVAPDIMELVKKEHPEYQTAPTVEVDPNETTWSVFKKTIDKRREAGLPDIIIPEVNTTTNVSVKANTIDERVYSLLMNVSFLSMQISGRAFSEITGQQPYHLFDYSGFTQVDFEPLPKRDGFRIQLDGYINFRNSNGTTLKFWKNPVTGKSCLVRPLRLEVDLVFKNDLFFTIDMPSVQAIGLIGGQSTDDGPVKVVGNSSVNFVDLIFNYSELEKGMLNPNSAHFYGTVSSFSNWLPWMDMDNVQGYLVTKGIINLLKTKLITNQVLKLMILINNRVTDAVADQDPHFFKK